MWFTSHCLSFERDVLPRYPGPSSPSLCVAWPPLPHSGRQGRFLHLLPSPLGVALCGVTSSTKSIRRTREPLSARLQDSRRGQPRASGLDGRGRREEGSAAGGGLLPVHPQCGDSRDVPSVPAPVPRIPSSPDA